MTIGARLSPLDSSNVTEADTVDPLIRAAKAARAHALRGPPKASISRELAKRIHGVQTNAQLICGSVNVTDLDRLAKPVFEAQRSVHAALPSTAQMVHDILRTTHDLSDRLIDMTAHVHNVPRLAKMKFRDPNTPALFHEVAKAVRAAKAEEPGLRAALKRIQSLRRRVDAASRQLHACEGESKLLGWRRLQVEGSVRRAEDGAVALDGMCEELDVDLAELRLAHQQCATEDAKRWEAHIANHTLHRGLAPEGPAYAPDTDGDAPSPHLRTYRLHAALDDCLRGVWHGALTAAESGARGVANATLRAEAMHTRAREAVLLLRGPVRDLSEEHERLRRVAGALRGELRGALAEAEAAVERARPVLSVEAEMRRQHAEEWRREEEHRNLTMHRIAHAFTREERRQRQREIEEEKKRKVHLDEEEEKLKAHLRQIAKQRREDVAYFKNFSLPGVPDLPPVPTVRGAGSRCGEAANCAACLRNELCGWCGLTGECAEGTAEGGPVFSPCGFHWRHARGARCDGTRAEKPAFEAPDIPHYIGAEDMGDRAVECERRKWDALEEAWDNSKEWGYARDADHWLPGTDLPAYCQLPKTYSAQWPKMQRSWEAQAEARGNASAERDPRGGARPSPAAGTVPRGTPLSAICDTGTEGDAGAPLLPSHVDGRHRPAAPVRGSDAPTLGKGARVQARAGFPSGNEYFRGTVVCVQRDGTAAVRYDNGEIEARVPRAAMLPLDEGVDPAVQAAAGPPADVHGGGAVLSQAHKDAARAAGAGAADGGGAVGQGKKAPEQMKLPGFGKAPKELLKIPKLDPKSLIPSVPLSLSPAVCKPLKHVACSAMVGCCWHQPVDMFGPIAALDPSECRPAGECEAKMVEDQPPVVIPPPPIVPPPPNPCELRGSCDLDKKDIDTKAAPPASQKGAQVKPPAQEAPTPQTDPSKAARGPASAEGVATADAGADATAAEEPEPLEQAPPCPDDVCSSTADCTSRRPFCGDVYCLQCIDKLLKFYAAQGLGR